MSLDQTFTAAQLIAHTVAVFTQLSGGIICLAPAISLIPDEWLN